MKVYRRDEGVSLVETMIAVLVALIGVFSIGQVIFVATATNKNQGTETTRAVIYAQDKLEKLLSLGAAGPAGQLVGGPGSNYAANYLNCTQPPASQLAQAGTPCNSTGPTGTTGITDAGWTRGLLAGGLISNDISTLLNVCPSADATAAQGYTDFLDTRGTQITGACAGVTGIRISYVRQWRIIDLAAGTVPPAPTNGPTVKQIIVAVWSLNAVNSGGTRPMVLLTSLLDNPNPEGAR